MLSISISGEFINSKRLKELSDNQPRKNKLESIFSAITSLERLSSLDLRINNNYFEGNVGIAALL